MTIIANSIEHFIVDFNRAFDCWFLFPGHGKHLFSSSFKYVFYGMETYKTKEMRHIESIEIKF